MTLNKNKSIGSVIYIVEGDNDEIDILKNIYSKILAYSICTFDKRDNSVKLINKDNSYSKVFLIPAEYSAVARFKPEDSYFDNVYRKLSKYGLDVENSAIYFLFDRDQNNNRPGKITNNMTKYKNSRDNDYEMNGLFLLSYPSIEAYYFNCNSLNVNIKNGQEAKSSLEKIKKDIDDELLIQGVSMLMNLFNEIRIKFSDESLDDFSSINKDILAYEDNYYNLNKNYKTLSLIFISLLDLGIIEL